ncbi:MAG: Uma2 family endonuclease, partial [Sandaracinaceae bacterium]|nr:Uma2 family endonuclease [Sandaracinaceae bacterium]
DESRDRVVKAEVYARGAVPFYWIVSPAARVLEAFELQGEKWLRLGAWTHEQLARVPPFDAVELALASIFTPRE